MQVSTKNGWVLTYTQGSAVLISGIYVFGSRSPFDHTFIIMQNFSISNQTSVSVITCSLKYQSMRQEDINTLYHVSVITSVVNALSIILVLTTNGTLIIALWKAKMLQTPSNILLCCLAVSDLLSGLISQPLFIISHIARIYGNKSVYCSTTEGFAISSAVLSIVSFLTFTAVSVDKFLALHLHLRYRQLVTNQRVIKAAMFFWVVCIVEVVFTIPNGHYEIHFVFLVSILLLGVLITLCAYQRLFHIIRKHEERRKAELELTRFLQSGNLDIDIKKHKRASSTMALASVVFLLCYLPYIGVLTANVVYIKKITSQIGLKIAGNVSLTIILANSTINPLLYCLGMRDVKQAVLLLLKSALTEREQNDSYIVRFHAFQHRRSATV